MRNLKMGDIVVCIRGISENINDDYKYITQAPIIKGDLYKVITTDDVFIGVLHIKTNIADNDSYWFASRFTRI